MWTLRGKYMWPVMVGAEAGGTPYHSMPTQRLPPVYMQNASLEMARTDMILATKTISGFRIAPFLTERLESIDINDEIDFINAEYMARNHLKR